MGGQNWSQQQQMQWNNGMDQSAQSWNGQQANWAAGVSPRTGTATPNHNMYPNMPGQHPGQAGPKVDSKRPDGAKSNVEMQPEAYQRTLEYVQQCQSWSSTSVVSPDSSSVNGAKQKHSPGHPGADAQAMPPPAALGSGAPLAQMAPQSGAMTPRHAPAGAAAIPVMGETPKQAQDSSSNMVIADMSSSMNTLMKEYLQCHNLENFHTQCKESEYLMYILVAIFCTIVTILIVIRQNTTLHFRIFCCLEKFNMILLCFHIL